MDLSTDYLGFKLSHPLIPGAGPLADRLDTVRRLEDAGAPMIVLRSLFEEKIAEDEAAYLKAENGREFAFQSDKYLDHIGRIKSIVGVPIVASLNGTTLGGWLEYARLLEEAGADALELNIYDLAADPLRNSRSVEQETIEMVQQVKKNVKIPLAVKISPFYTSLPHFAGRLDAARIHALVLFNRFYQPDVDLDRMQVMPELYLSTPSELLLRLRWVAILFGRIEAGMAVTGGVHSPEDAVKAISCGAQAVQVVSVLLRHGPGYLAQLRTGLAEWMEKHGFNSLGELRGKLSHSQCPNPKAFERANYMHILEQWRTG